MSAVYDILYCIFFVVRCQGRMVAVGREGGRGGEGLSATKDEDEVQDKSACSKVYV